MPTESQSERGKDSRKEKGNGLERETIKKEHPIDKEIIELVRHIRSCNSSKINVKLRGLMDLVYKIEEIEKSYSDLNKGLEIIENRKRELVQNSSDINAELIEELRKLVSESNKKKDNIAECYDEASKICSKIKKIINQKFDACINGFSRVNKQTYRKVAKPFKKFTRKELYRQSISKKIAPKEYAMFLRVLHSLENEGIKILNKNIDIGLAQQPNEIHHLYVNKYKGIEFERYGKKYIILIPNRAVRGIFIISSKKFEELQKDLKSHYPDNIKYVTNCSTSEICLVKKYIIADYGARLVQRKGNSDQKKRLPEGRDATLSEKFDYVNYYIGELRRIFDRSKRQIVRITERLGNEAIQYILSKTSQELRENLLEGMDNFDNSSNAEEHNIKELVKGTLYLIIKHSQNLRFQDPTDVRKSLIILDSLKRKYGKEVFNEMQEMWWRSHPHFRDSYVLEQFGKWTIWIKQIYSNSEDKKGNQVCSNLRSLADNVFLRLLNDENNPRFSKELFNERDEKIQHISLEVKRLRSDLLEKKEKFENENQNQNNKDKLFRELIRKYVELIDQYTTYMTEDIKNPTDEKDSLQLFDYIRRKFGNEIISIVTGMWNEKKFKSIKRGDKFFRKHFDTWLDGFQTYCEKGISREGKSLIKVARDHIIMALRNGEEELLSKKVRELRKDLSKAIVEYEYTPIIERDKKLEKLIEKTTKLMEMFPRYFFNNNQLENKLCMMTFSLLAEKCGDSFYAKILEISNRKIRFNHNLSYFRTRFQTWLGYFYNFYKGKGNDGMELQMQNITNLFLKTLKSN